MRFLLALWFLWNGMITVQLGAAPEQGSQQVITEQLTVSLISGYEALPQQGDVDRQELALGVRFVLKPEWHIYWHNPGDSGAAPKFDWQIEGGEVQEVYWPFPKRIFVGDLINFGYEEEVVFPVRLEATGLNVDVQLRLEWLVCKIECLPGFADLKMSLPVSDTGKIKSTTHPDRIKLEEFSRRVPQVKLSGASRFVRLNASSMQWALQMDPMPEIVHIFPFDNEAFSTAPPSVAVAAGREGDILLEQSLQTNAALSQSMAEKHAQMLVVAEGKEGTESFVVDLDMSPAQRAMWQIILFAFLGGIILNLMPCVFPILSIKILSFLHDDPTQLRRSGWLYTLGVLFSFAILGGALLILRAGGDAIGWGFQLQSPVFVFFLAMLFYILALNFLGFFEWGSRLVSWAGQASNGKAGAFMTGVLATVVATPCTAPFMGTALGVAVTLPAPQAMSIFMALGAGVALPLLLLSYFPRFLSLLPKPGVWMVTLKEILAFPLLATVIWLAWVLATQQDVSSVIYLLIGILGVSFFIWLSKKSFIPPSLIVAGVILSVGVPGLRILTQSKDVLPSLWVEFDEGDISKALSEQKPVFIDFTAAWCITCQWNKKSVLDTEEIQALFKKQGVYLVRADWTNRDEKITEALAAYGRNSLPLYVFKKDKNSEIILPELLTKEMIRDLFE